MTSKKVEAELAKLGFEYDEGVTGKHDGHVWRGTIDPIGNMYIAGDNCCMGHTVCGMTRAEMDAEAVDYAKEFHADLTPCTDEECEMHGTL